MNIKGFLKTTLIDYPEHVASILFLEGCNFRCGYCQNYDLVEHTPSPNIDLEYILDYLQKRKNVLDGVVISGGEPCIHEDLPDLIKRIKSLGYDIKLDTNGSFPDMLEGLINDNLVDYIAMDIKGDTSNYSKYINKPIVIEKVLRSIDLIKSSSLQYEFRLTVPADYFNASTIVNISNMLEGANLLYIQKFVQSSSVPNVNLDSPDDIELNLYKDVLSRQIKNVYIR